MTLRRHPGLLAGLAVLPLILMARVPLADIATGVPQPILVQNFVEELKERVGN